MKAVVTVNGEDRVGIIAAVSTKLAKLNINTNDIRQTTCSDQFNMIMLVDTELAEITFSEITEALAQLGKEISMEISIRNKKIFDAMHNI